MKESGKFLWFIIAAVGLLLLTASFAPAQDSQRGLQRIEKEVDTLKSEVNELRALVYEMREALLRALPKTTEHRTGDGRASAKKKAPTQEELTRVICEAVGRFFSKTETIMRTADPVEAEDRMEKAFEELRSALDEYSGTHRVSKLLGIYQGLTWDAYVAVRLRGSLQGNQRFVEVLNKHRQKYRDTCPQE